MTGLEYEHIVAKYLQKIGYNNVSVTPGSGDYGVDVLAYKDGHKYAVQCKYYSSPLGQEPIREAVAGMAMYGCDKAMVVTNTTFTDAARRLAAANDVVLFNNIDEKCLSTSTNFSDTALGCLGLLVIVFIAGGLLYGAHDMSKGASLGSTWWTWGCMIVFVTSPFWIWFLIKMLWRMLYNGVKRLFARPVPAQLLYEDTLQNEPVNQDMELIKAEPAVEFEPIAESEQKQAKNPKVILSDGFKYYLENREKKLELDYDLKVAISQHKPDLQKLVKMLNELKVSKPRVYYNLYNVIKVVKSNGNAVNCFVIQKAMRQTYEFSIQMVKTLHDLGLSVKCDQLPLNFDLYDFDDDYLIVSEQEFIDIIGIAEAEDAEQCSR